MPTLKEMDLRAQLEAKESTRHVCQLYSRFSRISKALEYHQTLPERDMEVEKILKRAHFYSFITFAEVSSLTLANEVRERYHIK